MFDRHFHVASTEHHHHRSEVHEHRAPTDESVKLLREMEQAALDKVLSTVRLEDAGVDCLVVHFADHLSVSNKLHIRYRMRGKEFRLEHTFTRRPCEDDEGARHRLGDEMVDKLARSIAVEMLWPAMDKALPRFNGLV